MAKLSTPYHPCSTRYVDGHGVPTGNSCPWPAYRRHNGQWKCAECTRRDKAREVRQQAAAQQPTITFTVIKEL